MSGTEIALVLGIFGWVAELATRNAKEVIASNPSMVYEFESVLCGGEPCEPEPIDGAGDYVGGGGVQTPPPPTGDIDMDLYRY